MGTSGRWVTTLHPLTGRAVQCLPARRPVLLPPSPRPRFRPFACARLPQLLSSACLLGAVTEPCYGPSFGGIGATSSGSSTRMESGGCNPTISDRHSEPPFLARIIQCAVEAVFLQRVQIPSGNDRSSR